jgi:hypothetical protein
MMMHFLKEMNELFAINPKLTPFLNTLRRKEGGNNQFTFTYNKFTTI